jgi:RimJ/RimL family protein N-acetyltransferase
VRLRPWHPTDLPLLRRLLGDPLMTEHLGGPESEEQLRSRHQRYCDIAAGGGPGHVFVITVGPEAEPAGSVLYWESSADDEPIWEIGWSVLPEFQGRGIATRGTEMAIAHAAAQGRHHWMHAFPDLHNTASNRLCARLGFENLGAVEFEYP